MTTKQFYLTFLTTLGILLTLSIPFAFTDVDLSISALFYKNAWVFGEQPFWSALYHYGTFPGLILALGSLYVYFTSLFHNSWERWKRPAAIILLTLLLGPGLLVNVLGKGYWGRPRPRDVTTFNGSEPFHRWTQPGIPGKGKSFPSGHPSVGYLFCVFFFLDTKSKRRWMWLAGGIAYGTLMGGARVIQGGHFASDVLWSGGLTLLSAITATYVVFNFTSVNTFESKSRTQRPPGKHIVLLLILAFAILGAIFFFLLATPFYKEHTESYSLRSVDQKIELITSVQFEKVFIHHTQSRDAITFKYEYYGFGFPKLNLITFCAPQRTSTSPMISISLFSELKGWTTEKTCDLTIQLPENVELLWALSNPKPRVLKENTLP